MDAVPFVSPEHEVFVRDEIVTEIAEGGCEITVVVEAVQPTPSVIVTV
jgi:hypothetical protein